MTRKDEARYDYRDISDDGLQWINRLRRYDDAFPDIDDLCSMTAAERDVLVAYLRADAASLTVEDNEFLAGVGDEIEAL